MYKLNKRDKIIIVLSILLIICVLTVVGVKIINYKSPTKKEAHDIEMNDNEECNITEEEKNVNISKEEENIKDVKKEKFTEYCENIKETKGKIPKESLVKNIQKDIENDMKKDKQYVRENTKTSINKTNEKYIDLEATIIELCKDKGLWSIYIKDLKSGESLTINNKKMISASTIKLFIMAKTYEAIRDGDIERTEEVDNFLINMITISHNESSNKLVELLGNGNHKEGMKIVNKYANSIGCTDTEQQRNMLDYRPEPVPEENYTSVENCGSLLEKIYLKECITPEFDEEMLNLLLAQQRNTKLPVLLPEGVKIAHKTGELSTTENDVGIVLGPQRNYIICIISNELQNSAEARTIISQISKIVYDFFQVE